MVEMQYHILQVRRLLGGSFNQPPIESNTQYFEVLVPGSIKSPTLENHIRAHTYRRWACVHLLVTYVGDGVPIDKPKLAVALAC